MRYKYILFVLLFSLCSYSLMAQTNTEALSPVHSETTYQIQNDILITQPQNNLVTAAGQISLFGVCDSRFPLYINGKEVSLTPNGYFALYVELMEGKNEFVFINNEVRKTIVITREKANLVPAATSGQLGVTTTHRVWDKEHTPFYGIINRNYVTHRIQPDGSNELLTPLAKGTTAQIIGETEEYYQLSDNTFVYKETLDLIEGKLINNKITGFIPVPITEQNCIEFRLPMSRSCLYGLETTKESAILTVHDTILLDNPSFPADHPSVSELKAEQIGKNVVYTLLFKKDISINGGYVYFEEGSLVLGFKNLSKLKEEGSLKGITIILDAGHGDTDLGAVGPLGQYGPTEKDINLQIMQYAKAYLEKQGATIITIREDNTFVPLAERVNAILAEKPDLSISIHCNAMPVTADYSKISGFLTFYTYEGIHPASEFINTIISQEMGFEGSAPRKSNLALTRITNCPALLLESGFLSNPTDYEWLISSNNQKKLGEAIGKAASEYIYSLN